MELETTKAIKTLLTIENGPLKYRMMDELLKFKK
jgi:hypothetical protein